MSEQAQVPTRKITVMIYPPSRNQNGSSIKTIDFIALNPLHNLALQSGCNAFVGIDDQHPFMLPGDIFQSPAFFSAGIYRSIRTARPGIRLPRQCSLCRLYPPESTTTISCPNDTLARHSRRFAASFFTGTSTDKGTRASRCSLIE